jgi:pimeloyl-ACP methyl ester carboxylesterase
VLLHGLRGSHDGLEPIVAHLARIGYGDGVVVPDLPGFGESPPLPSDVHDVAGYARWATELLAEVAPGGHAVLAGHSFGSIVAAATVARGAEVPGLVLINPITAAARSAAGVDFAVRYHRLAGALPAGIGTAMLRNPMLTRVASVAMATTADRGLRRWIHAEHGRHFGRFADRRVLLEAFRASVSEDVDRYAGQIAVPVLLVAGEQDRIAPLSSQRALLARLPDARLSVVAGTGHLTHYETPAAVAEAVAGFLAELGGPAEP